MAADVFRQTIEQPSDRVIVALDGMNWEQAGAAMDEVGAFVGLGKANALAQRQGWYHAVQKIGSFGARTMADAKFKDIPATMRNHVYETALCGPQFITVHADNNPAALQGAVEGRQKALDEIAEGDQFHYLQRHDLETIGGLLGITVLTSISPEESSAIYGDVPAKKVLQFAHVALEAGLDGIVCSGEELNAVRNDAQLDDLLTVVPGITPLWAAKAEDQQRVVTPAEAVQRGADFIVVGRAITQPPEGITRAEAAQRIAQELKEVA